MLLFRLFCLSLKQNIQFDCEATDVCDLKVNCHNNFCIPLYFLIKIKKIWRISHYVLPVKTCISITLYTFFFQINKILRKIRRISHCPSSKDLHHVIEQDLVICQFIYMYKKNIKTSFP